MKRRLILASQSPRRRALLEAAGYEFEVIAADEKVEAEVDISALAPVDAVQTLAETKSRSVAHQLAGWSDPWLVLAADTVADLDGVILGKPKDIDDARTMLKRLAGQQHLVHTGVCLIDQSGRNASQVASTVLRMDELSEPQIEAYLATNKWSGKAGAFGYQDGWDWLHVLEGEESNVVGLPLELTAQMLRQMETA